MPEKLCLVVCENLRQEVAAAIGTQEHEDIQILHFNADCLRPQPGWLGLVDLLAEETDRYGQIEVIISDGCVGRGDPPDALKSCQIHRVEQCCHLLVDKSLAAQRQARGEHLLTPGWLARWRDYLDHWGFDRESAREYFREFATGLTLLDTGVDSASTSQLKKMAEFLGLSAQTVPVSLEMLRLRLENIALGWRLQQERTTAGHAIAGAYSHVADYATAFDMIGKLASVTTESEAVDNVLGTFTAMFAPARAFYLPLNERKGGKIAAYPRSLPVTPDVRKRLKSLKDDYSWTESGKGFRLLITHQGRSVGVLEIDELAFPEYKDRYLNLGLTMGMLSGLAIANARTYEAIKRAEREVKTLLQSLEKRNAELATINEELESFSYSVSHDLRAPLRHVNGFSQVLLEDYGDRLDKPGKLYIQRMQAASQHMAQLIDNLLMLSRLSRQELRTDQVDLSMLAQEIMEDLQRNEPQRVVQVSIEQGLIVSGDAQLLRTVLENLLGNAWKFTGTRQIALIELNSVRRGGETVYLVRDNGVGFNVAYSNKLFGVFQRLHSSAEFDGTGIGLASAQRVIHRHGGRIWAEGAVDQGATFYFTL